MYILETYANNAKEALELGSKYLNVSTDLIEPKLIKKGKSKFLGLVSSGISLYGILSIESKTPIETVIRGIISTILYKIGCDFKISRIKTIEEYNKIYVEIESKNARYIIGSKGKNIDAIQYITNVLLERFSVKSPKIILDIGGYREQRKEYLVDLSKRVMNKVLQSKKDYVLNPLNPYERHIIHSQLQEVENIDTQTISSGHSKRIKVVYTGKDKEPQDKEIKAKKDTTSTAGNTENIPEKRNPPSNSKASNSKSNNSKPSASISFTGKNDNEENLEIKKQQVSFAKSQDISDAKEYVKKNDDVSNVNTPAT